MVEYARHYGVLDWIPEDRLDLVFCSNPDAFSAEHGKRGYGLYVFLLRFTGRSLKRGGGWKMYIYAVCHAEEAAERQRAELLE